ncbi:MAG: molybdopterin-guanine dinucleotide biosynthesis protein B [Candidatus Bipolaricaulia bacterium]
MIPAVSLIGHHDSGKTQLIADLLPILVARGLRVATVKNSPHIANLDTPGSDSARHFAAGASRVLLRGEGVSALFWPHGDASLVDEIDRLFTDVDLVLVEGGKLSPYPKIEIFRRGSDLNREPLAGEIDVAAVITDDRVALPDRLDVFATRELEKIADFVEALAFDQAQ